ncbi:hypothetical protein [Petroclostridium sp. X23]|uniref:hypothetical protein n=1 Tax=Petroclostridium sp. X23 TaxID=3045146 RepID=UPI0024AD9532|nr:hypothetical protein [Petroclostridium sp. X23]WHH59696.1 hypothetical protein QKW49_02740 [Petroclostridium sp. X23]
MDILKEFENWLITTKKKKNGNTMSKSSAYKYARAVHTISEEILKIRAIDDSLFNISSISELEREIKCIKENNDFNIKNDTGRNMYSVALEYYLDFMRNRLLQYLN